MIYRINPDDPQNVESMARCLAGVMQDTTYGLAAVDTTHRCLARWALDHLVYLQRYEKERFLDAEIGA